MNKYKGILLCSDLDGTLRDSKGKISTENTDAIKYFVANGGLFTLCTGRSPSYASDLFKEGLTVNAPLIALNGAMIYDLKANKPLCHNPMNKDNIRDFDKFLSYTKNLYTEVIYHCDTPADTYEDTLDKLLYKIVFVSQTPQSSQQLKKELINSYQKDHFITNSWPVGLEIMSSESTKGHGIKNIKKYIDLEITKTVCVGDYENDIPMLKVADVSYAVSNALDEVKNSADFVTVSNDEHAIRQIIDEL